jgi:hypothetical protein
MDKTTKALLEAAAVVIVTIGTLLLRQQSCKCEKPPRKPR